VSYPVTFEADYVERRSRLTTFFRLILAIPVAIFVSLYGIVAGIAIVIAWFAIVITARYPRALYSFVAGYVRCLTRVTAYAALLSDPYPPFSGADRASYPIRMEFAELERYSRLKTFFRFILAIPIVLLRYVMELLLRISAVFAWFVILILGRLPRGLYDVMVLANSYIARSDPYLTLLTETYPPFQDEQTRAAGIGGAAMLGQPSPTEPLLGESERGEAVASPQAPDESAPAPGESAEAPGESSQRSGQTAAGPGESAPASGEGSEAPGESAEAPGESSG
jgi:hypothetical protein